MPTKFPNRLQLSGAVGLIAVVLFLRGCLGHSSWTTKDSWYHPAASYPDGAHELAQQEVHEVISSTWPTAEAMLKAKPIIELSTSQTKTFMGGKKIVFAGKRPYLVRAMYLNKETGRFTVLQHDKRLWVEHGCLGHGPFPMQRQALVVFLKTRPTQVFVECSMAE